MVRQLDALLSRERVVLKEESQLFEISSGMTQETNVKE